MVCADTTSLTFRREYKREHPCLGTGDHCLTCPGGQADKSIRPECGGPPHNMLSLAVELH